MGMQLYDLAGADLERRFSPYCWRIKLALMHKGLPFDTPVAIHREERSRSLGKAACRC
jgi:Glutathione S-transferase, N-terminal domain